MGHKKEFLLAGLFLFSIVFLGFLSAVCCEKTDAGAYCQNVVDAESCNEGYRISENQACESTNYCSEGTCVNRNSGECIASSQSVCDPTLGGYWYDSPIEAVDECQLGCCLIGDGASYIEQVTCDTLGSDYDVIPQFLGDIDYGQCFEMAGPQKKGACVVQTAQGRDCDIITREKCQENSGEFHEGFLCTAPNLGSICSMTQRTTCVDGKSEVYFVDSCNNIANIYDATKIEDVEYWTYIKNPSDSEETCGVGESNTNSKTCGNCNYVRGSTCGEGNADYGNYICQDLGCSEGEFARMFKRKYGKYPQHGEEWCSDSLGNIGSLGLFEDTSPGQTSYRLYCYSGEVQQEICGQGFRNSLCLRDDETDSAACVPNRWQDCFLQNKTESCEDSTKRDCRVQIGANKLDQNGDEIKFLDGDDSEIRAVCVPKYPPALEFWNPKMDTPGLEGNPEKICGSASTICTATYSKGPSLKKTRWYAWESAECVEAAIKDCDNWKERNLFESKASCQKDYLDKHCSRSVCFKNGPRGDADTELPKKIDLKSDWVGGTTNTCLAMGDCGVKTNYQEKGGYNVWEDLFIGNYTAGSIPN